ncbi:hypothetical protein ACQ4LE_001753 [Meloidogyne hapla]
MNNKSLQKIKVESDGIVIDMTKVKCKCDSSSSEHQKRNKCTTFGIRTFPNQRKNLIDLMRRRINKYKIRIARLTKEKDIGEEELYKLETRRLLLRTKICRYYAKIDSNKEAMDEYIKRITRLREAKNE